MLSYVCLGKSASWEYFGLAALFVMAVGLRIIMSVRNRIAANVLLCCMAGLAVILAVAWLFGSPLDSVSRFRGSFHYLRGKDKLLSDFENSSACFSGRARLGETFLFLRGQGRVFTYSQIRFIRLRWVEDRGYAPEITVRDGSRFILWEDGVDPVTRAEAGIYYLEVLREIKKRNPEIVLDLGTDEKPGPPPAKEHSDRAEEAMRKYLRPEPAFRSRMVKTVFSGIGICIYAVFPIAYLSTYIPINRNDPVSIFLIGFPVVLIGFFSKDHLSDILSLRIRRSDFEKRMRKLGALGLMEETACDFGNSALMARGQLRLGKKHLFVSRAGIVCAYADIRNIAINETGKRTVEIGIELKENWYLRQGLRVREANGLTVTEKLSRDGEENADPYGALIELDRRRKAAAASDGGASR